MDSPHHTSVFESTSTVAETRRAESQAGFGHGNARLTSTDPCFVGRLIAVLSVRVSMRYGTRRREKLWASLKVVCVRIQNGDFQLPSRAGQDQKRSQGGGGCQMFILLYYATISVMTLDLVAH